MFGIALPPILSVLLLCLIHGCSRLQVVQWLGLQLLLAVHLEKLLGLCKDLISLGNEEKTP